MILRKQVASLFQLNKTFLIAWKLDWEICNSCWNELHFVVPTDILGYIGFWCWSGDREFYMISWN